jgi:hypothetical protein
LGRDLGPAGAFAQEYTVMPNAFSDKKLYGHEKASQGRPPVSDCTVKGLKNSFDQSKKRLIEQQTLESVPFCLNAPAGPYMDFPRINDKNTHQF